MRTVNNDTGSLKTSAYVAVGDQIQLVGESRPRTITYVMGKGEKQHVCCKGTGPFPLGEVEFTVISGTSDLEVQLRAANQTQQA